MLTSALKGVDSAVFLTIKALQDGTFAGGGNTVFGLDQDGVGLGTLSPKANADDVAATEKVEQRDRRRRDHRTSRRRSTRAWHGAGGRELPRRAPRPALGAV